MSTKNFAIDKKVGLFAIHDTGAPDGRNDYKTLVILHGLAWSREIFARLLPMAPQFNARIILVNRRDYPGSTPLDDSDRKNLSSFNSSTAEAAQNIRSYMRDRARDVYDFLCELVAAECIPGVSDGGGIIMAAWSFGGSLITALLAYLKTFEVPDVVLGEYIRRFILLDPHYHILGFPRCPGLFSPIEDPSLSPSEGLAKFPEWVSGFYSHTLSPSFPISAVESSTWNAISLAKPPPTFLTLSPQDVEVTVCAEPALPEGSDGVLFEAGQRLGLFEEMRKNVFSAVAEVELGSCSRALDSVREKAKGWWMDVEIRVIWCDHSPFSMPWGIQELYKYLEDAKAAGIAREGEVNIVRMRGANHFPHWEDPERTLRALLAEDNMVEP
ncbi:alpha/beta-hydrolase [Stereum hirsutum FP-91666 SS1]|uniref:alpha/beta-hydrolase n=1 Tax=Stereum hirsutum (strain FP-91666) TaxID=721885 RepID=UPI000444973A|nr:alpha/beta-hydrolase [Stereum hirsutum FP-91666 SS1]EIM81546.1 alpha/beta-hydrolase [Stereum hirsutum FP-91666 SS1]